MSKIRYIWKIVGANAVDKTFCVEYTQNTTTIRLNLTLPKELDEVGDTIRKYAPLFVTEPEVCEINDRDIINLIGRAGACTLLEEDIIPKLAEEVKIEVVAPVEAEPVVDNPTPVVDNPTPVVDNPTPVVDNPEPVVDQPAPEVDNPEPVVDNPTP